MTKNDTFRTLGAESVKSDSIQTTNGKIGPVTPLTHRSSRTAVYGFVNPQAEYIAEENLTVVVYRGDDADPYSTAYDHDTQSWADHTQVGVNPLSNTDEHGVPGVCVSDDGYIHVVYGTHSDPIQYAKSDNPYDTSSWTVRQLDEVPGATYNSPEAVGNDLYVHYRSAHPSGEFLDQHGDTYPVHEYSSLIRSTDGGDTWTDLGPAIDTTGTPEAYSDAYVADLDVDDSGILHITWTVARGVEHDDVRIGIYHATFDPADDTFYALDGTSLGESITWADHPTVEVVGWENTNVPRHAFADDGSLSLTFSRVESDGAAYWYLAEYDDSSDSWSTEQLSETTRSGNYADHRYNDSGELEVYMVGGTSADNSEQASGARGGPLVRWTRTDGSWDQETLIPKQLDFVIARTACVRNGIDEFAALASRELGGPAEWNSTLYGIGALRDSHIPQIQGSSGTGYAADSNRTLRRTHRGGEPSTSEERDLLDFGTTGETSGIYYTSSGYLTLRNDWGVSGNGAGAGFLGSSDTRLLAREDGSIDATRGGVAPASEDLSTVTGNLHAEERHHTGADANPAGRYWWDANGDVASGNWIRVGDNSTTITPS